MDDIYVERFDDDDAYSPLGSQYLLGVETDSPTAETVGGATMAVPVSGEGREKERRNDGHPCQRLTATNTCGFNGTRVPSITMPRLQFKTGVYY